MSNRGLILVCNEDIDLAEVYNRMNVPSVHLYLKI